MVYAADFAVAECLAQGDDFAWSRSRHRSGYWTGPGTRKEEVKRARVFRQTGLKRDGGMTCYEMTCYGTALYS